MAADRIVEMQAWADRENQRKPIAPSALQLVWFATLDQVRHQDHLVKGLLLAGSLVVVFGESNSGKTTWILDLALSLAAGVPWRARRVKRGLVLYIAGEGAASVRTRVAAYRKAHPDVTGVPFAIVQQAVDFLNGESISTLIETIKAAESESGDRVALVIVDTFARAIPGGNECDAQDVGLAVFGADRVRLETGTCLVFVHHAGKDPTKGARGSSALRAAADTEILIEGQAGQRIASVTKQRDLAGGERFAFKLQSIDVGTDEDGEPVTSCVVEHLEDAPAMRGNPSGKNQTALLTALQEWQRLHPTSDIVSSIEMQAIGKAQNLNRNRLREAADGLQKFGWLAPCLGGFRFKPEAQS